MEFGPSLSVRDLPEGASHSDLMDARLVALYDFFVTLDENEKDRIVFDKEANAFKLSEWSESTGSYWMDGIKARPGFFDAIIDIKRAKGWD